MKKFFLLIAVVSISLGAMAQKGKVTSAQSLIDQGELGKAKEAIDQALANESTMNWFNTYFVKGKLGLAVFESDKPDVKGFYADPLDEAYTAFEKAMELDTKGSTKKKIITNMIYNSLAVDLYAQGSTFFAEKNYERALKSFETQIKITESDKFVGPVDTGMYYNAGLAAVNSGKAADAIKFFDKCVEMKYLGVTPYLQLTECYQIMGDTAKAESLLTSLSSKFPDDKNVILNIIDFYIKAGKNPEAQKYIKDAKVSDPDNSALYFASGIIYLNENKYDEAIVELTRSTELKGDVYDTQYGLGASYINKAYDMNLKANEIMDVKKYNEAVEQINIVYAKALPYMEKALELKPNDVYSMRSLKELYYKLKQTDKYNAIKAKLDVIDGK